MVVHHPKRTNKYGMVAGFSIALLLRVLSGEPVLKYNAILKFPGYVEPSYDQYGDYSYGRQRFPFRNLIMVLNFLITISVTYLSQKFFAKFPKWQHLDCLE